MLVVGLDADDTLWENEEMFASGEALMRNLLASWADGPTVDAALLNEERRTLGIYGYGVKGFVLSMTRAALEVSRGEVGAEALKAILNQGEDILNAPVAMLPGVRDTIDVLARQYRLLLITKGDQHHQRRKIVASGLEPQLIGSEVVDEKDPGTYRSVLAKYGIDPTDFVMVGNSLRSDVQPVIAIGGRAIHIPHHITWELEKPTAPVEASDFPVLSSFTDLPAALSALPR